MYKFLKGPYPNREEILDSHPSEETTFSAAGIDKCIAWKKAIWKEMKKNERFGALKILIIAISPTARVRLDPEAKTPYYIPSTKTVFLNKHLSIISALHELGHHLYGESEIRACRFSVHLFKTIFPKAFAKLVWENNMFKEPK